ncbi:serine/threonine phosphatase [Acrasis kona]|uniref:Protein phosphatase n=1 Tax=Acrasis kona TaxID=1008807 RepID=A0AAW2Z209_9EUKA
MIEPVHDNTSFNRLNIIASHINNSEVIEDIESFDPSSPVILKPTSKLTPKACVRYNNADIGVYCKRKAVCDKRTHPTGEDAYMFANNVKMTAIGVADGVGGWSEYNIDPSIVSLQLMQNCKQLFSSEQPNVKEDATQERLMEVETISHMSVPMPKRVLIDAYSMLSTQKFVEAGSTTACVVTIDDSLNLSYANIGDSGFIVIRPSTGETIFRSREQQHYFNAPFQLAVIPPHIYQFCDPSLLLTDSPNDAESETNVVQLQDGDVIVMSTDGLLDNLFDHEIIKIVQNHYIDEQETSSFALAKKLVQQARLRFDADQILDNHTPFSLGAEQFLLSTGAININQCIAKQGKPDDVTCVVCVVGNCSPPVSPCASLGEDVSC